MASRRQRQSSKIIEAKKNQQHIARYIINSV